LVVSAPAAAKLVWHELECGAYRADLPLWRALAHEQGGARGARVLEIGAGTGRVALALAREGHRVTALERDEELLAALRARANDVSIETVCADARGFTLAQRDFDLCVVAMQTAQLFAARAERIAFMQSARKHLREGGLLALAIVTALEPFDAERGDPPPQAETARRDGRLYVSHPVRVQLGAREIVIERRRRILAREDGEALVDEREEARLARVSETQLQHEGASAGLRAEATRAVPDTEEHLGSRVVMLRA
jgi:SAM-dependent methyltransferase